MKKKINKLCISITCVLLLSYGQAQYLISSTYINTTNSIGLSLMTGLSLQYDADLYKMVYNTVDAHGQPTIASGAFLVPSNTSCQDFPTLVYHHGTSLRKIDVPSNDIQETTIGKIFAAGGYFVLMPDYIGMGDSPGLHPYCHGESEATASRDMIRAAREFITDSLEMIDNGEVFLTGYSQGGHAAMACHKYIEDNGLLAEFDVIASAPCSGPYEMSGAMADTILSPYPYSNPGYLVYLLSSYQMVYGNLYNSYSEILNPPYDTIVPPYFDGNNTTLDMGTLNNLLSGYVDSLMVDTVIANFSSTSSTFNHPLWTDLLANDNHDWTPQRPIKMYYCTGDEQVTYQNAISAESTMIANGATDVEAMDMGTGNHGDCVFPALIGAYMWFDGLRTYCASAGLSSNDLNPKPFAYPNPTDNFLTINTEKESLIIVRNLMGQELKRMNINANTTISTEDWSSGVYLLELHNEDADIIQRVIKQ